MSCKHGEWFKCEQCDEVDAAYDRGLADAANQTGAQLECTSDYAPTRLEYFTGLIAQGGWLSLTDLGQERHSEHAAQVIVKMANALIAELDKQP